VLGHLHTPIVVSGDPPTDRREPRPEQPTPSRGCLAPARVRDYFSKICLIYERLADLMITTRRRC
jgi:hypothetical protein